MSAELSRHLAESRRDRLRAIRELATPPDEAACFVLRRLLFTDDDAQVRAAAARILGTLSAGHAAEGWLVDSLRDRAPLVRDTILRALARCGGEASRAAIRAVIEADGIWWVRRSAVYALGAVAGEADVPAFTRALGDPFWRVRYAAVRVLAALGAQHPDVRLEMQDAPPSSTLAFLRGSWGPVAVEAPARAAAASLLPAALLDPDPAVVTARVADDPDVTPLALVELLCDPHATLREAAVKRLVRSGDLDAFEAALDWLEEPRIPQVGDTVVDLLDDLGDPALELARRALARTDRPAATKWAIDWIVASQAETLYDAVLERVRDAGSPAARLAHHAAAIPIHTNDDPAPTPADSAAHRLAHHASAVPTYPNLPLPTPADPAAHATSSSSVPAPPAQLGHAADAHRRSERESLAVLRRAAVTLADDADLATWAADPAVTDAAATELHARRSWDALASLDGTDHPRTRALQVDAAARRREPNLAFVRSSITDPHPGPRAIAARWLARKALTPLAELMIDTDPTVREAALSAIRVDRVPDRSLEFSEESSSNSAHIDGTHDDVTADLTTIAGALTDRDPWVRRAAIKALVTLSPAIAIPSVALVAFDDVDPGVRCRACELPPTSNDVLTHLVRSTLDADQAVRAAASDALDRVTDSDQRVRSLLAAATLDATARLAAHAWLVRRLDGAALELATQTLPDERDPRIAALLGDVIRALTASDSERRAAPGTIAAGVIGADAVSDASLSDASHSDASRIDAVPTIAATTERRPFGRAGFDVAPLAISGAFDLPVEGLEQAVAAGVDLFFWEPGYDLLARFLRKRPQLRVMTGTYHADARSIRADVDRALKTLGRETLDVFLLFWTRSPARVDAAAYACLDALRRQGKIRAIGFSTHHRDIARDAIVKRAWDVVMIRHSAAHPGIETELLPVARERGTAIVTFSALTYGRMTSGAGAPTPAECYRYSLAQPGVTACISAPRRVDELAHNLDALATPRLTEERLAELRLFGLGVRAESQRFNTLLRQPTRDAAAAAREMLASEPAPDTELRAPSATAPRRSRTRLGSRRRR